LLSIKNLKEIAKTVLQLAQTSRTDEPIPATTPAPTMENLSDISPSSSMESAISPKNVLFVPTVTDGIHPTQKPMTLYDYLSKT